MVKSISLKSLAFLHLDLPSWTPKLTGQSFSWWTTHTVRCTGDRWNCFSASISRCFWCCCSLFVNWQGEMKGMTAKVISYLRSVLTPCFRVPWPHASPRQQKTGAGHKRGQPLKGVALAGCEWHQHGSRQHRQPSTPPRPPSKSENERFLSYILSS